MHISLRSISFSKDLLFDVLIAAASGLKFGFRPLTFDSAFLIFSKSFNPYFEKSDRLITFILKSILFF